MSRKQLIGVCLVLRENKVAMSADFCREKKISFLSSVSFSFSFLLFLSSFSFSFSFFFLPLFLPSFLPLFLPLSLLLFFFSPSFFLPLFLLSP